MGLRFTAGDKASALGPEVHSGVKASALGPEFHSGVKASALGPVVHRGVKAENAGLSREAAPVTPAPCPPSRSSEGGAASSPALWLRNLTLRPRCAVSPEEAWLGDSLGGAFVR